MYKTITLERHYTTSRNKLNYRKFKPQVGGLSFVWVLIFVNIGIHSTQMVINLVKFQGIVGKFMFFLNLC